MSKKAELAAIAEKARELSEKADISDDEKSELDGLLKDGKVLRDAIVREKSIDEFVDTVSEEAGQPGPQRKFANRVLLGPTQAGGGMYAVADRKGFDEAVEAWKSKKGDARWGFDLSFTKADVDDATAEINIGALTAGGTASPPQYGTAVAPFYYPGIIEPPTRQPVIADLFAQGATDSNLVRLVKETVTTNGAVAVTEGAPYGVSEIQVAPKDFPVRDITTLLPVTEDILQDIPAMSSYLSMRLSKFVQLAEEAELLSGDGTGAHLEGILVTDDTTTRLQGSDIVPTAVMKLLADVYSASFMDPSWIAMSPQTWGQYVTKRDDSGAGAGTGGYLAGAVTEAAVRRMWGLSVTVSPVIPNNKIIVGSPAAGMVFRNSGLRVESSTGYGTFFGEGLVAIRAKVRTAFAVLRPQAIGILTTVGS